MQQPVQPRMHFLLAPVRGTCAHTDSAVLTDGRYTRSHKISPLPCRAAAHDRHNARPPTYCQAPRRPKDIDYIEDDKKSHESIVTAEKVIRFFRAVVRQRPRFSG